MCNFWPFFTYFCISLKQQSPTFMAPGTCFVEDNFSTEEVGRGKGFGMIQVHYIYCALYFYYYYIVIYNEIIIQLTIMLTGGGAQAVMRMIGSSCKYRGSFVGSLAAHLLLCGLVPNRPRTTTGPWPGVTPGLKHSSLPLRKASPPDPFYLAIIFLGSFSALSLYFPLWEHKPSYIAHVYLLVCPLPDCD